MRPIEAEFETLWSDLQLLETTLFPREPAAPPGRRATVVIEMERRLKLLEEEMTRSPVLQRR
jgi:hypothetical protein